MHLKKNILVLFCLCPIFERICDVRGGVSWVSADQPFTWKVARLALALSLSNQPVSLQAGTKRPSPGKLAIYRHRTSRIFMELNPEWVEGRHERPVPPGGPGRLPGRPEGGDSEGAERPGRRWDDADALGRLPRQPGGAAAYSGERVSPYPGSPNRTSRVRLVT